MLDIGDLPKAIQLALAPAFLMTGIGALLNVMTGRLARIIDRGRAFAESKVRCVSPLEPRSSPAWQSMLRRSQRYWSVS